MNHLQLSKRLQHVANYVPKEARLADIGSDHAYLPANLVLNQQITYALAGEVVKGPYDSAKHLVSELDLEKVIDVRLGDGLDVIEAEDSINTITICGMGGTLIRDILDRGLKNNKLTHNQRLVLQPNIGEYSLRMWLDTNLYTIVAEEILVENNKKYEIIVAERQDSHQPLTKNDALFGPFLLKEKSDIFIEKWEHEKKQVIHVLSQLDETKLAHRDKRNELTDKLQRINEVLKCPLTD